MMLRGAYVRKARRWLARCGLFGMALITVCVGMAQKQDLHATEPMQPSRSGSEWTVHFAEGGKTKYKLKPGEGEPGIAVFADKSGHEVRIMVADDAKVLIVPSEGGCYRTGTLVDGRVTNGTSGGDCRPGGEWTAEMR